MIVLDTNVVFELMRPAPEPRVLHWFSRQVAEDLHLTVVTMAEILHGIELISTSRRRDVLRAGAVRMFGEVFADRVLPFEDRAAHAFSEIAAARCLGQLRAAAYNANQMEGRRCRCKV